MAEKIAGGKKEETKNTASSEPSKPKGDTNQQSQPSKSAESTSKSQQQSPYVQPPKQTQTQSKPDLGPSLMDKVMARAQNAATERRSANERQSRDRAYYQQQSTEVLKLMKANMEEDNIPASQINIIDDILKDRRKRGK